MASQRYYVCQDGTELPLNRGLQRKFLMITTAIHEEATPQDPYLCDISTAGKKQIPGLKEMFTGSGRIAICAFPDHAEEYTIPAHSRQMVDDVDTGKRYIGRIWLNPPPKPMDDKEKAAAQKKKAKAEQKAEQQGKPFETVEQSHQVKSTGEQVIENIAKPAEQQNGSTKQPPKEPKKRTIRAVRIGVPNRPTAPIVTK